MSVTLRRYWFLLGLLVMIPTGLIIGYTVSGSFVPLWLKTVNPRWITAVVLFLMTFTLDSRQFLVSLKKPSPVLFAGLVNLGLLPLIACGLAPLQLTLDFQIGLMIAATVPCTLAAASVWTRKAGGNDAVSLLVTLTTNSLCVIVTPFWLGQSTAQAVEFNLWYMTLRLVQAVLIPTILGQLLRLIPANTRFATERKIPIGVFAQGMILMLVFTASMKAGLQLASGEAEIGVAALFLVWVSCLGLHLTGAAVGWWGSGLLKLPLADRKAILFSASQKTLPIGVLLATDLTMFGNAGVPFAIFPMLMYHTTQLVVDTVIAHRLSLVKEDSTN
ncbi:bile acid:sodium symporter [Planctomycetaceae bacterium]|jgi:solute carrier family 10 (sodium/bile acid cotransporter), member 7|nr:bile acid:sodium symporter [Planctomycetaceae bacterium]MDG2391812.1 bile acid:sodium symporter [Planctomycetaceae bacterium]